MKRLIVCALVTMLFTTSTAVAGDPVAGDPVEIVTDDEASQPDAPARGKNSVVELSDGPFIDLNNPASGSEVPRPVTIDISFKPHGAPIDITTLKVTYLKLFNIDITDRVREYATQSGIKIVNAAFPAGTHRVRFSLQDTEGNQSEKTLSLTILEDGETAENTSQHLKGSRQASTRSLVHVKKSVGVLQY